MTSAAARLLEAASKALRGDDERRRAAAALLLAAFPTEEAALPLLCHAITLEVSATEGVLWRGGGLMVELVGEFARQAAGRGLVTQALGGLVRSLCKRPVSVEVDPARVVLELGLEQAPSTFSSSAPGSLIAPRSSRSLGSGGRSPRSHSRIPRTGSCDSVSGQRQCCPVSDEVKATPYVDTSQVGMNSTRRVWEEAEQEAEEKKARERERTYYREIVAPNRRKLESLALEFINSIGTAMENCSPSLRALLRHMFDSVRLRFPGSEFKAVGALLYLRLFCPAIVAPDTHNLVKAGEVTPKAKRSLVLVAKLLQTLVNETPFEKEECMMPFNKFIQDNIPLIHSMFRSWMGSEAGSLSRGGPPVPLASHLRPKELRRRLGAALGGHCSQEFEAFLAELEADGIKRSADPLSSFPSTSSSTSSAASLSSSSPSSSGEKPRPASVDSLASLHKKCSGSGYSGPCKEEVLGWTVQEVVRWLKLSEYSTETVEVLEKARVDGKSLLRSSAQVLLAMGVLNLGDRKKLVKAINEIAAACLWSWVDQEVEEWQMSGVAMWLSLHGLHEYADLFIEHGVTGEVLLKTTQEALRDVGVAKFGHIKRILKMVRELAMSPQERLKTQLHPEHWTLGDVCDWLRVMEMQEHIHLFVSHAVDGLKILQLTDAKLASMGVDALGHRVRIMKHVRQLNTQW